MLTADQTSSGRYAADSSVELRPTILLVDDAAESLHVLNALLCTDYRLLAATSGHAALRIAAQQPHPDLILLDIVMPDIDGYSVIAKLRESYLTKDIPVIFLTAASESCDEERGLRLGAADYITKPISPLPAMARIAAQIEAKRTRDGMKIQTAALEAELARRTKEHKLTQQVTIRALTDLAEAREPASGNRILRIQCYVRRLAESLVHHPKFAATLTKRYIDLLSLSTPLHDIGSIVALDAILLRSKRPSPDDSPKVQPEAEAARDTNASDEDVEARLRSISLAKEIAHWHHEKWDGSGYPDRLVGDAIPLSARLMALADVFDALLSLRADEPVTSYSQARNIILGGRGSYFDPDIVATFDTHFADFVAIAKRFKDKD